MATIVTLKSVRDGLHTVEVKREFDSSSETREFTKAGLNEYVKGLKQYCRDKGYEFIYREELTRENFQGYYDTGLGFPFDENEIINFCIKNQHLFTDTVFFTDSPGICDPCEEKDIEDSGIEKMHIFRMYTDESINLFKQYVNGVDAVMEEGEIDSISYGVCKHCGKWVVTH